MAPATATATANRLCSEVAGRIKSGDAAEKEIIVAKKKTKQKYVIVRTYSAGVFAGNLVSRNGQEVVLADARRFWAWAGAASLSQMAVTGTINPSACKFPVAVSRVELMQAIEILDVTPAAEASIKAVPVWSA
jgi:hypothetical protein